jgi:class III poly(R)-hydroxyalkanoic acid synthase PhaE subunit
MVTNENEKNENWGSDAFKTFSEYQKNWLRMMNTTFPGFSKITEDAEGKYDWTSLWRTTYDIYNRWLNMSREVIKQNWKGSPLGADRQAFEGMLDATDIYNKMYEFWAGATKILSGEVSGAKGIQESYEEFSDSWTKNYNEFINTFFTASGIEPLKRMGVSMDLPKMYTDLLVTFIAPWMEATHNLPGRSIEALKKGPHGYADIYLSWLQAYEQTQGKILRIPPMGIARQSIEKLQRLSETMIEHSNVMTDYSGVLCTVGTESMQKVSAKLGEMYIQGQPPKTYREFYTLWLTTNEDDLYQLYKTPEFSRLLGRVIDITMRLQQRYNGVMEEFLKVLPIPTRSEMDDLYKTLYLMKKEVKNNPKRMGELEGKLRTTETTLSKQVKDLEDKLAAMETTIAKQLKEKEVKLRVKKSKAKKETS